MEDDSSSQNEIKKIAERLDYLESVARDTAARLYAIETRLGLGYRRSPMPIAQPAQPPQPERPPKPAPIAPPDRKPVSQPTEAPGPPAHAEVKQPPDAPPLAAAGETPLPRRTELFGGITSSRPLPRPRGDLEARIGGNWFNRIGIIAICFGVAFFLKYAFDNEWIGPAGRVLIGAAVGVAFLVGGERLRKRYASYAYGLTGGGLAILYLAIWFASQNRYNLIPQMLAFVLMAGVTATGSVLSARYNALPIAVLALIGGFLTPILLSTGVDNPAGLFGYIALLDGGVLALAYSKQWRGLNYLAFIATVLMFGAWYDAWYAPEKLRTTIVFLTVFFVIFALLAVLYNVVNRQPARWPDLALVFLNALIYFGTSYNLLEQDYYGVLGAFAVLVSGFYLALGYFTYRRDREDTLLVYTFLGLASLFAVLAVPIQFDQHWVTIGWAVEGALLTLIGLRAADRISRYAGFVVFFIAGSHWLLVDVQDFSYGEAGSFAPLLNRRALSGAVLAVTLAAAAYFYKRYAAESEQTERSTLASLYVLGANLVALALLSIEANDYFEQARLRQSGVPGINESVGRLVESHRLTISALWSLYAAGMLVVGITRQLKALRVVALLLLAITTIKVLTVDLTQYAAAWHLPLLNQTFAAFAVLILALGTCAWYYLRDRSIGEGERKLIAAVLLIVANVVAVVGLSAEAAGYFDRALASRVQGAWQELENTKQLALSMLWSVYGTVALIVGANRGVRLVRWGALFLLSITAVKLLVIDAGYYGAEWHQPIFNQTFLAFAMMVAALSCAVAFYARAEKVNEAERRLAINTLMASANVFAIIALSAEATGYYERVMRMGGLSADKVIDLEFGQRLALSVVWILYGGAMLAVGIWRRNRLLRVMSLVLLSLATLKVFFVDLAALQKLYRIISFIVLGLILLAVSFLYQRLRQWIVDAEDGEVAAVSDAEIPLRTQSE